MKIISTAKTAAEMRDEIVEDLRRRAKNAAFQFNFDNEARIAAEIKAVLNHIANTYETMGIEHLIEEAAENARWAAEFNARNPL